MQRMLPLMLIALLCSGCTTSAVRSQKSEKLSIVERAPASLSRSQMVADRTRTLMKSGQYSDRADAARAASADIPDLQSQEQAEWARRRERALKQKAIQDKFEQELAKLELK